MNIEDRLNQLTGIASREDPCIAIALADSFLTAVESIYTC